MALQSSGAISIGNISVELGQASTTTHSLNDASFRSLAGVPSGAISMSNFYGKSNAFIFNSTISANTTNYNIKSAAIAAGWDQVKPLKATVTVNSGIYVYASTTAVYGMQTGSTFPAGTTLAVINNGLIVGCGGAGGAGGSQATNGGPGLAGGVGFLASVAVSITNNGTVGGGGGGGGGAGGAVFAGDTGGGGGGRVLGAGGGGLTGNAGTLTAAGAGRGGGPGGAGTSGAGGNLGTAGSAGTDGGGTGGPGAGGAAGACTTGNANITWVVTGTRLGALN